MMRLPCTAQASAPQGPWGVLGVWRQQGVGSDIGEGGDAIAVRHGVKVYPTHPVGKPSVLGFLILGSLDTVSRAVIADCLVSIFTAFPALVALSIGPSV